MAGTKLCMSSAYHPQSDGQTERVNQCLEAFLRCFVHSCPKQWLRWISLAKYWYNTSLHSSLNRSPSRYCTDTLLATSAFLLLKHHLFLMLNPCLLSVPLCLIWFANIFSELNIA